MPKQVYVESRDQTIEVPDDFTPEEIQNAIATSFSDGQDIAFDLQKFQEAGGNTKDFIAGISDEDYIKLNNFRSDKNMTAAELGGITLGAAKELFKDILKGVYVAGKTMLEDPGKGDNLSKVLGSAARGVGAGSIDLAQLGLKLLDPTKRIPTFDEFAKQPVTDYGYAYGPAPSVTSRAATPDDYKNLIDSERKKELAALEMVEAADKLVQGAAIEDVAKGARFFDAFSISGLARGLAKGVGKGIAKKGFYEATTGIPAAGATAPGKVSQTAAKVAEVLGKAPAAATFAGAKAAEVAAKGVKIPLDVARKLAENEVVRGALGAGIGYSQGDIKGAVTGLTAATIGTAVASKFLEGAIAGSQFIGTAAKGALNSASRTGFVEQMLKNPKVSPSVRKIANALLPLQPAFQFAGQVAKETAKDFIPAAGIGAGLGYMAGGEEGAAAGIGSALGVSTLTGPIKASVSAVKTLAKAPTARGDANALGDIKTFVNAIPDEKSRIEYAQIMDQAIKVAGPERAADMLDALRLAEAHGATVVVGPKNSPNAFDIVGNTISINPSRLNAGTVFHETTHQLVNVGIRASLLPELRNLYDGIRDADGNILKPGLYTEADWAAKAKELAESYKNNPQGYQMALDVASKLENPAGYSPEAIQAAKDFVLDEATASYAERLMGRSRPGAFNPDRLPMWHRNLLEQIDNRVLDNLATELYSGQTNLNTPSKAFTDANGRPVRIPQLDVILRKALSGKYPKSGGAMPKQAAPKTVPIPKNPVDVSKFAQATFGATRDILGTDENGNPRLLTEKEHQAVAKADYEAAVQAFQQLSPDDQATVRLVNRKGEPASITDKDYQIQITSATPRPVFERFLQVAKDRGMGNQQLATMRQLYESMVSPEGPTFDTVNNPVWKYSKRTGQMESTVRPPTRQEIYPLFIHVNSAGGFNVKYIDLSRLKQNAQKIMSNPKHKGIWPSTDAFMDDFKRSMRNLSAEGKQPDTPSGSKSTAELLGNGDENLGAVKRDLIAEALNVTLPERLKSKGYENEPVFEPLSLIGKEKRGKRIGESAFRDFRIERVTEITPTKERLKVVQENAYDKLVRRFQPDSFTPETLPNGEAWTNPDGYRILKKTGSKLYRVYDDSNESIGVASTFDKAVKMAQRKFIDGWHGSPHNFMRFTTQKIGTGEGAQAYGYGLYIAENKGVAQGYRKALTTSQLSDQRFDFPNVLYKGEHYLSRKNKLSGKEGNGVSLIAEKLRTIDNPEEAKKLAIKTKEREIKDEIQLYKDGILDEMPDISGLEQDIEAIKYIDVSKIKKLNEPYEPGSLYRVQLNVMPDQLLDWDKPLSEQPKSVQKFAEKYGISLDYQGNVYRALHESFIKSGKPEPAAIKEKKLAKELSKAGIPGIRYLDQGSRSTGEGTSNYVIFDEGLIRIVDRNNKPVGKRLFRDVADKGYSLRFQPDEAQDSSLKPDKKAENVRFQPITPEQDAAYINAVKSGDSETVQAMVDEAAFDQAGLSSEDVLRLIDQNSPSMALNYRAIAKALGGKKYILSKVPVSSLRFEEGSKSVVDAKRAIPSKGPIIIGVDGVIVDGRHRAMLAKQNKQETILAYVPQNTDPVTYDDAGNLIPLSQRFNPSSNDIRFQPDAPTNDLRPLTAKALSTDWESYPKTRGELTKEKIITALKGARNIPVSQKKLAQFVASYDNAQDLLNHTYYHGTQNIVSTTLKPSITLSERQAEQMGGGGYGERYWAISLSKSKRKSEAFAGQSRSVRVHPVLLKKSAKVIEIPGVTDAADLDKYIVELWNNKIDAVWIGGGEQELAVINPKAIVFSQEPDTYAVFGGYKSEDFTLDKAKEVFSKASEFVANPELSESFKLRFQPDPSMPSVLNGSNGTRIIKSNSGKFRVYSGTGALLGIRDTQQAAEKLSRNP